MRKNKRVSVTVAVNECNELPGKNNWKNNIHVSLKTSHTHTKKKNDHNMYTFGFHGLKIYRPLKTKAVSNYHIFSLSHHSHAFFGIIILYVSSPIRMWRSKFKEVKEKNRSLWCCHIKEKKTLKCSTRNKILFLAPGDVYLAMLDLNGVQPNATVQVTRLILDDMCFFTERSNAVLGISEIIQEYMLYVYVFIYLFGARCFVQ